MSEKHFEMDIFSFERAARTSSAPSPARQYYPYESAWKEFDKLCKTIHDGGPIRFAVSLFELALLSAGTSRLHLREEGKFAILLGGVALSALGLFRWFNRRSRFLYWACPRCHSEWPGGNGEKDRACKVCGLRLHQLSP